MCIDGYAGMTELSAPLAAGMPTIFSYWSSDQMFWMDGEGLDQRGLRAADNAAACSDSVKFYDFSIDSLGDHAAVEDSQSAQW